VSTDAYARSGVDQHAADHAVGALVAVLKTIDPGRRSRSVLASGHYAAVLEVAPNLGIAVGTDGVGTKLILAEQTGRYDTVGIDCVAMNVNDVVCVGAEPIALLDYLAVEQPDPAVMEQIGIGLKRGAELAGVEIPGGEVAILPELIRGHPSPHGFDLTATCFGTVALDAIVTGEQIAPGDALIGLPSSGLHSNSYTLARKAVEGLPLEGELADQLLEPTVIYVRAVLELLRSGVPVHGLAHITGGGLLNLLRLNAAVGFAIEDPLPVPPIIELVKARAGVSDAEAWEVFNMGCGFVVVTPDPEAAASLLAAHHTGTRRIGTVTGEAGSVRAPEVSGIIRR
jgi:phosphoribosylformylglycinamidine cyclo-ligase